MRLRNKNTSSSKPLIALVCLLVGLVNHFIKFPSSFLLGMESHSVGIKTGQGKQDYPAGTPPCSTNFVTQEQAPEQSRLAGAKLTNATLVFSAFHLR